MKIVRSDLVTHLQRILCGGQVKEAVFRQGMATSALTADHLLMVEAPALPKSSRLLPGGKKAEIGVPELTTVIRALGFEGEEHVEVTFDPIDANKEHFRLVLGEGEHGEVRLVTSGPRTIVTAMDPKIVDALKAKVGDHTITVTQERVRRIKTRFSGLNAEEVVLVVGKNGGEIQIGTEHGQSSTMPVPELKAQKKEKGYELLFGSHLIDVLSTLREETATISLSGEGGVVSVQDGDYQYLLSPRSRAAAQDPPAD